ncbi:hypothetical protein QBC41DRAFT_378352, partial [Cercophora samala]
ASGQDSPLSKARHNQRLGHKIDSLTEPVIGEVLDRVAQGTRRVRRELHFCPAVPASGCGTAIEREMCRSEDIRLVCWSRGYDRVPDADESLGVKCAKRNLHNSLSHGKCQSTVPANHSVPSTWLAARWSFIRQCGYYSVSEASVSRQGRRQNAVACRSYSASHGDGGWTKKVGTRSQLPSATSLGRDGRPTRATEPDMTGVDSLGFAAVLGWTAETLTRWPA